ncbi:MAG: hypothetical protein O3A25_16175 [Acidobacteria bacterium]|nr:hypothetical protein [Acidobacteriota bacterium]
MKLPVVVFGLVVALCAVTTVAFLTDEVPFEDVLADNGALERVYTGHGVIHDRFPSMNHGGDGPARHTPVLWLGWAFGVLQLGIIVGCLMLGVTRGGGVRLGLGLCGLLLGGLFTMMVLSYRTYLTDATPALLFGLPAPAAWFLYGLWPAQFVVVLLYVLSFSRSIVTPDHMRRFEAIVAARRVATGDSAQSGPLGSE